MSEADGLELCVLSILRKEKATATQRMIQLALSREFESICRDCKSAVDLYETCMKLYRAGRIKRRAGEGGFIWSLE